ncbi:uncharacterized protein TNIN_345121 [Trichonephila inaurata madagascariensis]|uniref:DUF7041 domain-containing protein n=1 Tax=Trichonephila inaurata madagascariensis TaxID=2747483 RepID=A0A8X6YIJ6_9ARAC|nr:uncharacterized protein TNIN_345121 [Trichonephila inaurata madagascariensis]
MAINRDDSSTFNLGDTNTEIHKVPVKPPAFWRNKPKLWFLQLEAQFSNSGISNDTTKYNIVAAALDENVLDFVADKELGDRRPSDLLRQMKSLAGSSISDELIKSLWLQKLPQQTQAILSISKDSSNNIAEMADKIIAVYSSSEVCSVTNNNSYSKSNDRNKLEALKADIAALTKIFNEFSRNSRQRSKSREYSRRNRSKSNSSRYAFCWYHFKFGNAKKCVQSCQFKRDVSENE